MKGIAHFASGLCVATFVPGVVEDGAQGGLLVALGGACAMLPDFLDFRFAKFVEKRDADIAPDPVHPDPQVIADAIAYQIALARTAPRVIQLHPFRRGVVDWVLYDVRFDSPNCQVVVTMNGQTATAHAGNMHYAYDGALEVGELGGPSLKLSPPHSGQTGDAATETKVTIEFLPWHRTWSHSLVLALGLGMVMGLWLGPTAGLVAGLGYAVHVLEDQLGYMGSNLFWPFTRQRFDGAHLLHSGDTEPNLVTVWFSLSLILLNLDRARLVPLIDIGPYLAFVVVLPSAILIGLYVRKRWHKLALASAPSLVLERNRDAVDEARGED
jgi:hypothetical protein